MMLVSKMSASNIFNALALVSVCVTAALHWYGVELSLYWTIPWWDILAHFFGGLTIGLWVAAVVIRLGLSIKRAALFLIILTAAVSIGWEVWEALEGLSGGQLDTIKDLVDDMLGAGAAWLIYKWSRMW